MDNLVSLLTSKLLCNVTKTLPLEPVMRVDDGCIYERREIENIANNGSDDGPEFVRSKCLKEIIQILVNSGEVSDGLLGEWKNDDFAVTKKKAEEGDTKCMIKMGKLHLEGDARDEEEAFSWFKKAEEEEDPEGMCLMADCLIAGVGVGQDCERGHKLLVEAATDGSADATLRLWYYFSTRVHGFEQDLKKIQKWKGKSIELHPDNYEIMLSKVEEEIMLIRGDDAIDVENLLKNAPDGNSECMVEIGELYLRGKHVRRNEEEAYRWFKRSADAGNELGRARVADCLIAGKGTEEDDYEGHTMLLHGTKSKETVHAALRLWYYFTVGTENFPKNPKQATKWLGRLKEMNPDLEDAEIERMQKNLTDLIGTVSTTPEQENDIKSCKSQEKAPGSSNNLTEEDTGTAFTAQGTVVSDITEPDMTPATRSFVPMSTVNESNSNGRKPCHECGKSKSQGGFSPSQWKRRIGTGRCVDCVSKSVQWGSGTVSVSSLTKKKCMQCQVAKPHAEFSPNQWRRTNETGRCRDCVDKSLP